MRDSGGREPGTWDVVVTCGGTGGHVLPALAVIDELEAMGLPRDRIGFVGGRTGIETTAVPGAGVDFVGLDVRGLERDRTVSSLGRNAAVLVALARSVQRARTLLRRSGAQVVLAMGGYASLPAVLAARRQRNAVVVYESNSVPGIATRVASRKAVYVGTAFERAAGLLPDAERVGFVVRPSLSGIDSRRDALVAAAREAYDLPPGRRVVLVMGGSQGARTLNDGVVDLLSRWRRRDDLAILHLVGRREHADVTSRAAAVLGKGSAGDGRIVYVPIDFEEQMERAFAVCDVAVCRSGAATCAELVATGTPALLVPYPHATDDHQRHNAEELVATGAAGLLDDGDVSAGTLSGWIDAILGDARRFEGMRRAAADLGASNGARRLATRVCSRLSEAAPGTATKGAP